MSIDKERLLLLQERLGISSSSTTTTGGAGTGVSYPLLSFSYELKNISLS
jgi:hypothetical protein